MKYIKTFEEVTYFDNNKYESMINEKKYTLSDQEKQIVLQKIKTKFKTPAKFNQWCQNVCNVYNPTNICWPDICEDSLPQVLDFDSVFPIYSPEIAESIYFYLKSLKWIW